MLLDKEVSDGPITSEELDAIDADKMVDPYLSGYVARRAGKKRRARECYVGEKKQLWLQGWDDSDLEAKEEAKVKLEQHRLAVERAKRNNDLAT